MKQTQNSTQAGKHFFQPLINVIDAERYERVQQRFNELYTHYELPQNKILCHHLEDGILPGLALYQVIQSEKKTKYEPLSIVDDIFSKVYLAQQQNFMRLGKIPFIYGLLRMYIKTAMKEYPEVGWEIEWLEVGATQIRFSMHRCYYFDTLTTLGAPELTPSFCQVDDQIYGDMSPHIGWKRTQTIGRGAEFCDFCFAKKIGQADH